MRKWLIAIVLIALLGLPAGCAGPASDPGPRPAQLIRAFDAAINAHDADAVLELFADGASVTVRPDYVYRGRSEIRDWLNAIELRRLHVEARSTQINGNTVTRLVRHTWDQSHAIELFQNEVVIQQGKIVSYTLEIRLPSSPTPAPDTTPEPEP